MGYILGAICVVCFTVICCVAMRTPASKKDYTRIPYKRIKPNPYWTYTTIERKKNDRDIS